MPYLLIVLVICSAVLFYQVAEIDDRLGLLWATLSLGLGLGASVFLGWGLVGLAVSQLTLFLAMFALHFTKGSRW